MDLNFFNLFPWRGKNCQSNFFYKKQKFISWRREMDFARKRWISRVRKINLPRDKNGSPKRQKWNGGVFSDPTQTNKFGGKTWTFFDKFDNIWYIWQFQTLTIFDKFDNSDNWEPEVLSIFVDMTWHQEWHWTRVWRIYSNIRIFEYFWSEYLFGYSFVSFFGYEYIRIFVRVNFLDTNIFGYSFVSTFWIWIYSYIRS